MLHVFGLGGSLEFHTFKAEFHNALQQMCVIGTGRAHWNPFLPETRHADSYVLQWTKPGPRFRPWFGLIAIHYASDPKIRMHGYVISLRSRKLGKRFGKTIQILFDDDCVNNEVPSMQCLCIVWLKGYSSGFLDHKVRGPIPNTPKRSLLGP